MANKTVGVNIAFNADTSKAKAQIQELQTLLNKITYSSASSNNQKGITKELQEASAAAKELQYHLNNAYNANTGKLDLSLLDKSLKTTGSNITDLSTSLLSAGTTGQQAFVKMAQSISQAEQPMLKINSKVKDFANTLKNAAKYQIGNIVVQGLMGSLSSAVDYAKDLNTSLNEIRIVSGSSADEMARFAEEANKAAKKLSSTTLDYTNASLIYYQQGLSDAEVQARTETTLKMANVAGTSAQTVSDQMTAVWNNFYDGSKSLEYYSDVMVELGAATASSTDEISEGVNKFAATAKTVGLSYEYATAALATVTATTRESADTVGNAFKTLFSRIQGLNLGETLDDGTTLNKYSKALQSVGISIKDQGGQLKEMDQILDEMGGKWSTLGDAEKMALAQTVGGARQYTQLMALMENWDYFKENLDVAYNSEGALEKQQEIYAESWDAASDRVKASIQGVYQSLLDDKFFISLSNGFANALGGLEAFIEGAGGAKTIITGLASVMIGAFANKIPDALETTRYNFELLTKGSEAAYKRIQDQSTAAMKMAFEERKNDEGETYRLIDPNSSMGLEVKNANDLLAAKNKLALVSDKMTKSEKAQAETTLSVIEGHQKEIVELKKKREELELQQELLVKNIKARTGDSLDKDYVNGLKQTGIGIEKQNKDLATYIKDSANSLNIDLIDSVTGKLKDESALIDEIINKEAEFDGKGIDAILVQASSSYAQFSKNYTMFAASSKKEAVELGRSLVDAYVKAGGAVEKIESIPLADNFKAQKKSIDSVKKSYEELKKTASTKGQSLFDETNAKALESVKEQFAAISNTIPEALQNATGLSDAFRKIATATTQKDLDDGITELENALRQAKLEGQNVEEVLQSLYGVRSIEQLRENMGALALNARQAEETLKGLKGLLDSFNPNHVVTAAEALARVASIAGNIVTLGNALNSVAKALDDDTLSGWEKFSAILTAISTIIPTVTSLLQGAGVVLQFVKGGTGAVAGGMAAAGTAAGGAAVGFGALLTPLLIIVGTLAALTALLWGVNKLIKEAEAASPEGQLERAKELTEEMATAAYDAQNAYSDLLNTIDSYDSAIDKLAELDAGTTEFTNTLLEANEEAWKLIDAFGLIKGQDWHYGEHGEIIIEDEAIERGAREQQEKAENVKSASIGAEINEINKEIALAESNVPSFISDFFNQLNTAEQQRFTELGQKYKENKNTSTSTMTQDEIDEYVSLIQKAMGYSDAWANEAKSYSSSGGYQNDKLNAFNSYSNEGLLDDYLTVKNKDTILDEKINPKLEQMLTNSLANEKAYQESEFAGEIVDKVLSDFDYQSAFDTAKEKITDVDSDWKDFVESSGYVLGDDGKVYTDDKHTEEVYAGYSEDEKKNAIAAARVGEDQEQLALQELEEVNKITDGMSESQLKYANAIKTGDLSKLTEEEAQALQDGTADIKSLVGEGNFSQLAEYFGKDWTTWINAFNKSVDGWEPPEFDLSSWKSQYTALQEIYDDVASGKSIEAEDYDLLDEKYQQYFERQIDGNYELIVSAEKFKTIIESIPLDELKSSIAEDNAKKYQVLDATGYTEGLMDYHTTQWNNFTSSDESKAQSVIDNNNSVSEMANALDIDLSKYDTAVEKLQALSAAWQELQNTLGEKQDTAISAIDSLDELIQLYNEGTITLNQYEKAIDSVARREAKANDIDYESVENYTKYLMENAEALKYVDDNLKTDEKLAKKVATAHAKLNKGVKTLSDNWEKWNKAIKSGSFDEINEVLPEINNALKDMFDLEDNVFNLLSSDFAAKNWDLIRQAVNGVEGAYEKLQVAMGKDLLINLGIDESAITTEMSSLMLELSNMVAGTELSTDININNANALDALSELLSAAGLTTDQIMDFFDILGWDPQLEYEEMDITGYTDQDSFGYQNVAVLQEDGSYKIETMDLAGAQAIAQDGKIKVPKIVAKKKTAGSGSYTPQKTFTGGGGGGGSTKTPTHAEKKSDSDKTRYHTLTNQLEDIAAEYDDISEAAERAFGKDKLKNLDAQIKKTDELIDKQEEYLDAIKADLPVDKAVMDAYYQDTIGGPAIEYDERGNIANYDAIQDAMFAKYNQMAETYDEDSTEWQVFEKKYEQLEKYIEQYEETYDLLRDQEQEYQDLLNQRIDLQLEKVQYTVELKLNVSEDQVKLIEYQLGKVEDDGFKSLEAIGLLTNKAGELNKQIEANKQGLNDALKLSLSAAEIAEVMAGNMDVLNGKNFTDDQISAIRDYRDELLDLNEQLDEIRETVEEKLMEAFDAWQEKLEKGIDTIDHYGSVLESYQNIIDIVGTDTLGLSDEFMNNLSQGSVDNAINKLEAVKAEYYAVESARAEAEEKLADARAAGDTKSAEMWEKTLEDLTEKSQEAEENMLSAWEDALSKVAEQFEQSVERIVNSFNKSVYKMGGLEGLSNDFAKQQEEADMMLDDYQKIYELSKLSRDINKSIDDTDLIGGKQKLKKLLGEVNALQEDGVEMSQYDLEYLQKTYDLRLAELELEEAQRAKNTVRLSKDNEGNWSYVYTQNTDAVDAAQQKYEDALYAMQDLSSNYIDEMSEKIISTEQEMADALAAIRIQDYSTMEEYQAALEKEKQFYLDKLSKEQAELDKAIVNNKKLYDEDWTAYHNATGYKISDTENFVTSFKDSMLGSLMDSESVTVNITEIISESVGTMIDSFLEAGQTYFDNIDKAFNAADTSTENFGNNVAESVSKITSASELAAQSTEDMADRMNSAVGDVMATISKWQQTYGQEMDKIIDKNNAVVTSINNIVQALSFGTTSSTSWALDTSTNTKTNSTSPGNVYEGYTGGFWGTDTNSNKSTQSISEQDQLLADSVKNILVADKDVYESFLKTLELYTQNSQLGLGQMTAAAATMVENSSQVLQQSVEIHADFPSVVDHNEVEEAIMNLTNTASQYANRK